MADTPYSIGLDTVDCSNVCDDEGNKVNARKANKNSKNCKKTANNGQNSCDKNTTDCVNRKKSNMPIIIKIDCGGYPSNEVPLFQMKSNPERWMVRRTVNGDSQRTAQDSDTDFLKSRFLKRLKKLMQQKHKGGKQSNSTPKTPQAKLPQQDVDRIYNLLKMAGHTRNQVENMTPVQIINAIEDMKGNQFKNLKGYKPNYHHLRPTWGGGTSIPSNVYIAPPSHKASGVHQWWKKKLEQGFNRLSKREQDILQGRADPIKEKPKTGKKKICKDQNELKIDMAYKPTEENITRMAEHAYRANPRRKLKIEMKCPEAFAKHDGPSF